MAQCLMACPGAMGILLEHDRLAHSAACARAEVLQQLRRLEVI